MSFAMRIIMALVARFKGLGFLEWAGIASLVDTILTYDVKQQLYKIVAEEMSARAGIVLNPDDPFSDASVSAAIGDKVGIPLRSVKDKQIIKEDIDNFLAAKISATSGYQVTSVVNVEVLKSDLERIGAAIVSERSGLPLGVFEPGQGVDGAVIKERILQWAEAEIITRAAGKVGQIADKLANEADLEAVAQRINGRLGGLGSAETVTALAMCTKISVELASAAVQKFGRTAQEMDRKSRKRELGRAAQARFRAAHGTRQKYVPIGMPM